MLDRLDWTERLSLGLTVVFVVTLALTLRADSPWAWLLWGTAMVLLGGSALVIVNRGEAPPSSD